MPSARFGWAAALLSAQLLGGCESELGDGQLDMEVEFTCPTDRLNSELLHLIIHEGSCTGDVVYSQELRRGELAKPSGELTAGDYAFEAILVQDGALVAQDCVASALPTRRTIKLTLATETCQRNKELQMPTTARPGEGAMVDTPLDAGQSVQPPSMAADGSVATGPDGGVSGTPGTPPVTTCTAPCALGQTCSNGVCKTDAAASKCTLHTFEERNYWFCSDVVTWPSARRRCRALNMGLVTIESAQENEFVHAHAGGVDRWLGGNDLGQNDLLPYIDLKLDLSEGFPLGVDTSCVLSNGPIGEGNWYWSSRTGDTTNETPFCAFADVTATSCSPSGEAYTNWAPQQPDNGGCVCIGACLEGQDCAMMRGRDNGMWDDATCGAVYAAFVCEAP